MQNQEIVLIFYFGVIILIVIIITIIFISTFIRRKNKLLLERLEAEQRFEKELVDSRLEIQEQTLKNVAWELHDNVGQLLSVANMQLNMLIGVTSEEINDRVKETKEVITATVQEVRALSKTLNSDVIQNNGLVNSIRTELERFNRLNFLYADLKLEGEVQYIKSEDEIIIFRIIQEFFSNVIKHARAKHLFVHLCYTMQELTIIVKDDGVGFNAKMRRTSSGLQNMESRAKILNATYNLDSEINRGTELTIIYPYPPNEQ